MQRKIKRYLLIKKGLFLSLLLIVFISATSVENRKEVSKSNTNTSLLVSFPEYVDYNIPYLEKNFVAFKEALAFKESQGKYTIVNSLGYLGKYQFGKTTLHRFKIYDTKDFLNNPELQEKAFIALCKVNKWILRKDIKRFVGKTINGIKVTESGILAAAHLGGAGNVKKYLRSNGLSSFADAYGASVYYYMKKFAGYNVSNIKANRKATV